MRVASWCTRLDPERPGRPVREGRDRSSARDENKGSRVKAEAVRFAADTDTTRDKSVAAAAALLSGECSPLLLRLNKSLSGMGGVVKK